MKITRILVCALLLLSLLLSVSACGYPEIESSEEELATVLTLDGKYEIPYEQYRFLFLSERGLLDKDEEAAFSALHEEVLEELCTFYATFSLAEKYGIDPYSKELNEAVKEGVKDTVEGGNGALSYAGVGDHDAYLEAIRASYMNDSVFRFLLRYRALEAKLGAKLRDEGIIRSDKESVLAYMNSEECVRVSWIYIPNTVLPNYTEADLAQKLESARAASDEEFLRMTHEVIPDTYTDAQLEAGFYLGRYQLDPYYEALTDAVFSLDLGETSNLVSSGDGVYIVRRLPKDAAYLDKAENLPDFTEYFLLNQYYKLLAEEAERLAQGVSYAERFYSLTLDGIRMPEKE